MQTNSDILYNISLFLSTRDIMLLSMISKKYYKNIMCNIAIMKCHEFTLNKKVENLRIFDKLRYKVYNINLNSNKYIKDEDFNYLKNIYILNMSDCCQYTITDKAFENLRHIYSLNMSRCRQKTITDKAFKNLKGVHTLDMSACNQVTITDKAFKNLQGIYSLDISGCDQEHITDKAFDNLKGIRYLNMQTYRAYEHL